MLETIQWHSLADNGPPKIDGQYLVLASSADPECPLIVATWFDTENGFFEIIEYWRKSLTHWAEMPKGPRPPEGAQFVRINLEPSQLPCNQQS